jgi:hypothetical protein
LVGTPYSAPVRANEGRKVRLPMRLNRQSQVTEPSPSSALPLAVLPGPALKRPPLQRDAPGRRFWRQESRIALRVRQAASDASLAGIDEILSGWVDRPRRHRPIKDRPSLRLIRRNGASSSDMILSGSGACRACPRRAVRARDPSVLTLHHRDRGPRGCLGDRSGRNGIAARSLQPSSRRSGRSRSTHSASLDGYSGGQVINFGEEGSQNRRSIGFVISDDQIDGRRLAF